MLRKVEQILWRKNTGDSIKFREFHTRQQRYCYINKNLLSLRYNTVVDTTVRILWNSLESRGFAVRWRKAEHDILREGLLKTNAAEADTPLKSLSESVRIYKIIIVCGSFSEPVCSIEHNVRSTFCSLRESHTCPIKIYSSYVISLNYRRLYYNLHITMKIT